MAKKNKKQRHAKKREKIRKRQKAQRHSLPKILRTDPELREALDYRHPLEECLINKDWQEHRIATVFVIRDAPTGFVFSYFLVDLAGFGLKDAGGDYGLTRSDIEAIKLESAKNENPLISCDLFTAETIIYGGVNWSKKWNFKLPGEYKIWLRILQPGDQPEVDLELFGQNGKPLLILDEEDLDTFSARDIDPKFCKNASRPKKKDRPRQHRSESET